MALPFANEYKKLIGLSSMNSEMYVEPVSPYNMQVDYYLALLYLLAKGGITSACTITLLNLRYYRGQQVHTDERAY